MSDPNETLPGARSVPPPTGDTAPHERPAIPPQPVTPPRPAAPPVQIGGNVGGDVAGGDLNKELNAGRDIVGRDVVTNTTTTNVGFTVAAVTRLVLAVGALVAATAACFFAFGAVTVFGVVVAFNRPVNSNNQVAAVAFAANLANVRALPVGQPYQFGFTEEEISSYFHLLLEPNLQGQISGGQVRLLPSGQVAIMGRAAALGGLRFAATFGWQKNTPGAPLRLTGAFLHVLPLGNSPLGWIGVPVALLQPFETTLNSLFGNVALQAIQPLASANGPAWAVTVVGH